MGNNIFYVEGIDGVRTENRGSIFRDFVVGKSPIALKASALMHFIHKSALYESTLLKSSMEIL
jgi:hypothetical protein